MLVAGEGTDTILDLAAGIDLLGLAGGLSFSQLEIVQVGRDAAIKLADETLAQLMGIAAGDVMGDCLSRISLVHSSEP